MSTKKKAIKKEKSKKTKLKKTKLKPRIINENKTIPTFTLFDLEKETKIPYATLLRDCVKLGIKKDGKQYRWEKKEYTSVVKLIKEYREAIAKVKSYHKKNPS